MGEDIMTISIRDWIADYNEEALLADGFDSAIIGMCSSLGNGPVVAYDRDKCIEILMDDFEDGLEDEELREEAEDYFEYNVAGSYVGEYTPVFLTLYRP